MDSLGFEQWLLQWPIWLIGLSLIAGMLVMAFAGSLLRWRQDAARPGSADEQSQEGHVVSAVLGLLALLMGFTFALAIDRFDTRRDRVLVEANAIGTTYLRAQLLEEPHRDRISRLLIQYTDNRLALGAAPPAQQQPLIAENDRLVTDLWTATVAAFPTMRPYDFSNSFLETMNALIDMDAARKIARKSHVPGEVFLVLFLYQLACAGVLGYVLVDRRGRVTGSLLFILFGLALVVIIDIDRPASGGIRESQEAMIQLRETLSSQPPKIFDRFNSADQSARPPGR